MFFKVLVFFSTYVLMLPSSALAVIGGQELLEDEGVYLLKVTSQNGVQSWCTGVAFTPYLILTAAHCVAAGFVGHSAEVEVFSGKSTRNQESESYIVVRKYLHPRFQQSDVPAGKDLAVLAVTEALARFRALRRQTLDSKLENVKLVGYGVSQFDDLSGKTGGNQRVAILPITLQTEEILNVGNENVAACYGDSGAPLFGEKGEVLAIMSYGFPGCKDGMIATLIANHIDFIDTVVEKDAEIKNGNAGSCQMGSGNALLALLLWLWIISVNILQKKSHLLKNKKLGS